MTIQVSQDISQMERRIFSFLEAKVGSDQMLGWVILLHHNPSFPDLVHKSRFANNMVYKRSENTLGAVLAASGQLALDISELKKANGDCMFVCNAVKCSHNVSDLLNLNIAYFLKKEDFNQRNISVIAEKMLNSCNINKIGELLCFSEGNLNRLTNIGNKLLGQIRQALKNHEAKLGMFASEVNVPINDCVIELVVVIKS